MKRTGVWIGTSGWVYKEWAGHFYPKGWPKKDEFAFYAGLERNGPKAVREFREAFGGPRA